MAKRDDDGLGRLLDAVGGGDDAAMGELARAVHRKLRAMAARMLRDERGEHSLQPTALVNEAWVRLLGNPDGPTWQSDGAFLKGAATAMRRVLIDYARGRGREKRGGGRQRVPLDPVIDGLWGEPLVATDMLDLHIALEKLAVVHPRAAQVVELRIFCGLTIAEAATALELSTSTVDSEFRAARAWLAEQLDGGDDGG